MVYHLGQQTWWILPINIHYHDHVATRRSYSRIDSNLLTEVSSLPERFDFGALRTALDLLPRRVGATIIYNYYLERNLMTRQYLVEAVDKLRDTGSFVEGR